MQAVNIEEQVRACASCFLDPSEFKEYRENNPLIFLRYVTTCADYLGLLPNSEIVFYNKWISTDVKAEREQMLGMSHEAAKSKIDAMLREFMRYCYEIFTRTDNCPELSLEYVTAIETKSVQHLTERSKHSEHFFRLMKSVLYESGSAKIVIPSKVTKIS